MDEQLGPYIILGKLAAGGMATVYVAKHSRLENAVGLKVLHPHYQADEQLRTRFVDEARIQANLKHPNILQVQDILELPEASAMVMELLSGCALDTFYAKVGRPLPVARIVPLFVPLLDALAHAHEQGIVHRDMKPSNVFLHCQKDAVIPKLMDFGIAKLQRHAVESQVTAAGSMLGTPQYMAPEQFEDSSKVDARADQFAVGVMLYEAALGTVPFGGDNVAEIMKGILTKAPVPPSVLSDGFPTVLEAIIMRCLAKDREARFESVAAIRDALAGAGEELGGEAIPATDIPQLDLREKGIDITSPITSSRQRTHPDAGTHSQRPQNDSATTRTDPGPGDESWVTGSDSTQVERALKKGSRWGLWGAIVLALVVCAVVAAFFLMPGKGGKKASKKAAVAVSEVASDVAKPRVEPTRARNEEEAAPPLSELAHRDGLQLGSCCNPNATSLVEKMVNARLMGGWRGKRLSTLAERQLNQLGVTNEEQENFRVIRGQSALIREVDRMAIAAAVKPFKVNSLTDADLDELDRKFKVSDELRRYVDTKVDYLCRSLPLSATGRPEEVGALYHQVLQDHDFEPMEFTPLDSSYADDRLVEAEYNARAVCCLLKNPAIAK